MAITLRNTKGSALTHQEMDTNFSELDSRIIDSAGVAAIARSVALDSAEAFQLLLDSSEIINLINSEYIRSYALDSAATISLVTGEGYTKLDSADTVGIIDSHVDNAFLSGIVDSAYIALRKPDYTANYQEDVRGEIDSDFVRERQITYTFADFQSETEGFIDSDYVQARQKLVDSSDIINLIDSDYIRARQLSISNIIDSATILGLSINALSEDDNPALSGNLEMRAFKLRYNFYLNAGESSSYYTFTDSGNAFFPTMANNPTLYLRRGESYTFVNRSGGHPMQIEDSAGNAYEIGVINNRDSDNLGYVSLTPAMSAPSTLRYQCLTHDSMGGIINIV